MLVEPLVVEKADAVAPLAMHLAKFGNIFITIKKDYPN